MRKRRTCLFGAEFGDAVERVLPMAASLRRQIERETGPIRLVTPTNAIPKEEYVEEVQEWNP